MMEVVYVGVSDNRVISEADFKKMGGVKHKDMTFPKGQQIEVSNSAGEALLGHELIAGEFVAYQQGDPDVEAAKKAAEDPDTSGLLVNIGDDDDKDTPAGSNDTQSEGSTDSTTSSAKGASSKASSKSARRSS